YSIDNPKQRNPFFHLFYSFLTINLKPLLNPTLLTTYPQSYAHYCLFIHKSALFNAAINKKGDVV
ncbi:MAG: hypothetical protein U9N57_12130, partial [Pseudomonadota bacterium]|nr:hypothetical protein [Pseudomonadota bacterium]